MDRDELRRKALRQRLLNGSSGAVTVLSEDVLALLDECDELLIEMNYWKRQFEAEARAGLSLLFREAP